MFKMYCYVIFTWTVVLDNNVYCSTVDTQMYPYHIISVCFVRLYKKTTKTCFLLLLNISLCLKLSVRL